MVEPDIAGEPLEDFRQFIERAALEGGAGEIPVILTIPVHILKLMLHVKKPYSGSARHPEDGNLKNHIRDDPKDVRHPDRHKEKSEICKLEPNACAVAGFCCGKPMENEEESQRRQDKEDDGITSEPVGKAPPARGFQVFLDGQGPDVTHAPAV